MNQLLYENSKDFSIRNVSVDQAIKLLRRNGIRVNKESAEIILDFLYCIAKTYKCKKEMLVALENEPLVGRSTNQVIDSLKKLYGLQMKLNI